MTDASSDAPYTYVSRLKDTSWPRGVAVQDMVFTSMPTGSATTVDSAVPVLPAESLTASLISYGPHSTASKVATWPVRAHLVALCLIYHVYCAMEPILSNDSDASSVTVASMLTMDSVSNLASGHCQSSLDGWILTSTLPQPVFPASSLTTRLTQKYP